MTDIQQQQQLQHQQPQQDRRLASHLQIRRSQAKPDRTLFGSVLERLPDAEVRRLPECDAPEARAAYNDYWKPRIRERPAPQRLPPELAKYLRDRHGPEIETNSRQVDEYRQRLRVRERRLNLMERDAKYVFELPHPLESLPDAPHKPNYGARPRWMSTEDLGHSAEVNPNFLAPGVRNFNRDKYRKLAESHSYALAGDPLRAGMDFDCNPADMEPPPPLHPLNARPDRLVLTPRTEQRLQAMRRLPPSSQLVNGVEVPTRLLHQFGAEACQSLLANQDAVLDTSRRMQQQQQRHRQPPVSTKPQEGKSSLEVGDATYEQLGNALRGNVFGRGYSLNQRVSGNHRDFGPDQFARRERPTDEHRYQMDHVSRWAEANVLEMRMKKALQERMDRMLKKTKADAE